MAPDPDTQLGPAGVVVGIGDQGLETVRGAVRLGAEEAALRHVSLRLVHGSRPFTLPGGPAPSGMEFRQQRGRRLVNGAARDLATTSLGRSIQVWTECSPRTGADLLLAHSRTATLLVLQRCGTRAAGGSTTRAVSSGARCPMLLTRPADRTAGELGVLVLLDPDHDPATAIDLGFLEASLRETGVTLLDGHDNPEAVRTALGLACARHPDVAVSSVGVGAGRPPGRLRELSLEGSLLVTVRPGGGPSGLATTALQDSACPVLLVTPVPSEG